MNELNCLWSFISGYIKRKNERQEVEVKHQPKTSESFQDAEFWSSELNWLMTKFRISSSIFPIILSFFSDWVAHLTGNSVTAETAEQAQTESLSSHTWAVRSWMLAGARSASVHASSSELDTNSASMKTNLPPLEHLVTTECQQTRGKTAAAGEYSGLSEWTTVQQ